METDEILRAGKEHVFPSVFHYFSEPLLLTHAKNQFCYDAEGNEYLDFFGGIATISVGHCNTEVSQKVIAQLERLQHVSTVFVTEPMVALAKRIAGLTPGGRLRKCFFSTSGTEANEAAILAARCYTGSLEVVALRHSYHGRSALTLTLTGQSNWRYGLLPQPGIVHAMNAYCYRCPFGLEYPACGVRCAHDVENVIRSTTSGKIAAFIAEPVQGVAGCIVPPKEYFAIVSSIVHHYGGVFIADEVQTAWGRTGSRWFGIEHWGVEPDVITSAKGLGNGFPIAVTAARAEIADSIAGPHIATFGGNPMASTAASAVIDYIDEHDLLGNAERTGAYLRGRLEELQERHRCIGEVRGMGLLQAVELVQDRATREPAPAVAAQVLEAARRHRILVGKGGMYGNVIRISPPLNISKSDVDEFVLRLDQSLVQVQ